MCSVGAEAVGVRAVGVESVEVAAIKYVRSALDLLLLAISMSKLSTLGLE